MARRDREINIFNIAFLDVITGAMGAFVLLVVLLAPYVKKAQETPQQQQQQQEEDVQKTLDRAEQNMQQADQAMQTDDVEKLKRLLAQARADLAEARKQLDALQQELVQAQQQLQQAEAENEDLGKRLQQAIAEADAAREQVVNLNDALDHSGPVPTSWALIEITALPSCGATKFGFHTDLSVSDQFKPPPGFPTLKDMDAYLKRSYHAILMVPSGGTGPPFHMEYVITPPYAGTRVLFGLLALSAPPPGCQVQAGLSFSVANADETSFDQTYGVSKTRPLPDTRPVLFFGLSASKSNGFDPTPADISEWQKVTAAHPGGAAH
jgi:flagellar motor protein MotB